MGIDDALISTGVDSLIKLVHSVKKIELNDAALKLGIPAESIEEWAHILEDEGILTIEYRLTKVYLVWVGIQAKELLRKTEAVKEQKESMTKDIQFLMAKLDEPGLDSMQMELEKFLQGFNERVQSVKKSKETYRNLQEEKQNIYSKFSKLAQSSQEDLRKTTANLEALQKRLERIRNDAALLKQRTSVDDIEKAFAKVKDFQKLCQELDQSCEQEAGNVKSLRKDYDLQIRELNSQYEEVEERLKQAEEDLERRMQSVGSLIENVESLLAKKPELEDLASLTKEIQEEKDKLAKELAALAREVAVINVQGAPELQKVQQKVSETVKEEELYEEKRKRLMMMVKKMLSQQPGSNSKGA